MTQKEAIDALDKTIFNKAPGIPDDQLRILLTKEIANHLVDKWNATMPESKFMLYKKSGETFYYKGIECKVI